MFGGAHGPRARAALLRSGRVDGVIRLLAFGAGDHRPEVALARRVSLLAWARSGRARIEMARALGIGASSASDLVRLAPQPERVHTFVDRVWDRLQASKAV